MRRPAPIALNHAWFSSRDDRMICLAIRCLCGAVPTVGISVLFWSGLG